MPRYSRRPIHPTSISRNFSERFSIFEKSHKGKKQCPCGIPQYPTRNFSLWETQRAASGSEDFPMFTHEVRELQQYHRTLISHLFVLLPILFLTHWQTPYQTEIGRVGSRLLISLLGLRHIDERDMPAWIHAQYFGNLWTVPVQGRNTPTSLLAVDWADTLSIWIYSRLD